MQWPAVNIQRSCIMVPPQKCPPRRIRLTMKGISLRSASLPPTILGLRALQGSDVTSDSKKAHLNRYRLQLKFIAQLTSNLRVCTFN